MRVIDGKAFAAGLSCEVASAVDMLRDRHQLVPGLAVVIVGDDAASQIYVKAKLRATSAVGIKSIEHRMPASVTEEELLALIGRLNTDPAVHGILVQLPLPAGLDARLVINAISVAKDVDGFHIHNIGALVTEQRSMVPCTPMGCLMLLRAELGELSGLNAVVIGKSNIVGKPMAQLLLNENCTVTVAHIKTRNVRELCQAADIIVVAAGSPELVRGDWIKPGAVVVDVGINRVERGGASVIVGDVAFPEANHAAAVTPVPGGVGPMTIACLLANTVNACCDAHDLPRPDGLGL